MAPIEKENLVMRTASVVARYLTGVIFLVMGLNGFLNFIPLPPPGGVAGQFMGALYVSHYLWVIFAFQVIAGVLLLVNRYVPLAVAVLAPIIVNILTFHASMAPSGLPLALFVAVLWALIFVVLEASLFCMVISPYLRNAKRSGHHSERTHKKVEYLLLGEHVENKAAYRGSMFERGIGRSVGSAGRTMEDTHTHLKSVPGCGARTAVASTDPPTGIGMGSHRSKVVTAYSVAFSQGGNGATSEGA